MKLLIPLRGLLGAIGLSLLLISQTACTATKLPPYEASYTAKLRGIKVKGYRKFEVTGKDTYRLSWKAKKMWMRLDEWSEFKVVDEKVIPISYHYTRKGLGSDRPIHIYFDWENMQANASKGDKNYQFALEPNVVDKLSFQVQMQIDLLENNELTAAHYRVADYKGLKDYTFNYLNDEVIDTELGEQSTRVFQRKKESGGTWLWISPKQHYLPVKIETRHGKKHNVMTIRSWAAKSDEPTLALAPELTPKTSRLDATGPTHANNPTTEDEFNL